ncbi:efflux RND transporter periplasmic adaptor subunit [Thioalkalivibrio sp.]|uniref:efflux RND transporter periplasmic adaptor subunit n=1 Tax=Thioalkalivibrio sp. TaxID=2093813 RepID=UPI00356AAF18
MNRRFFLMLLVVAMVFGGIFGFKAFIDAQIETFFDEAPVPTATITATTARVDRWTPEIRAIGSLEAVQGATLSTEVGGIVREILFQSGSEAVEGTPLLRLDTETDRAELVSLEAAARLAEQEWQRARRLVEERNISEAEVQRRRSELEQARAAVATQRARINQRSLRAPFDGVLGIRRVNLGQYVSPGDPIVTLESLDPIYVNFTLAEGRLGQASAGQVVQVRVDAFDETFEGRISAIEPRVRAESRSYEVQALVQNPERRLRAGQFARVTLATGEPEERIVLPQTAIRFNPFGNSVFVLYEDEEGQLRVRERFVQTGERRGDLIQIIDGLAAGERVASSGLLKLQNETPVAITEEAQPSEEPDPRPDNA